MCEHYRRHEEMVYLLGSHQCLGYSNHLICMYIYDLLTGRMGNQKRALKLIINELQDVDKVQYFCEFCCTVIHNYFVVNIFG